MFKKVVQQGHSHFDARCVHGVREHGKMARTPLATFFNIPILFKEIDRGMGRWGVAIRGKPSILYPSMMKDL
jgi:hypothetical protein